VYQHFERLRAHDLYLLNYVSIDTQTPSSLLFFVFYPAYGFIAEFRLCPMSQEMLVKTAKLRSYRRHNVSPQLLPPSLPPRFSSNIDKCDCIIHRELSSLHRSPGNTSTPLHPAPSGGSSHSLLWGGEVGAGEGGLRCRI
jgi:hypothetical protein